MLIASKYEEIYHPTVEDFVYITDNSYTAEEVRSMERLISGASATALPALHPSPSSEGSPRLLRLVHNYDMLWDLSFPE